MKLSLVGRFALALLAASALGLGMTGCGGGTVAFLWTIGQQYNQISGFKVDDYTGNLTQIPHQPFSTAGTNPVSIVVKPGGRYVYVLNQGVPVSASQATSAHYSGGNVAVFSVGGDGVLTLQQTYVTQGYNSQWMQMDSTGQYLYVLDQYGPNGDGNGVITAYQSDSTSGRLTLLQNQATATSGNAALTYFEVGSATNPLPGPFMEKTTGNCLFVATPNRITSFSFSGGQLIVPSNGAFVTGTHITSINGNSSYLVATDATSNTVTMYTVGSNCALQATGGGPYLVNTYAAGNPVYSLIDNSNQFVYVLLNNNTNGTTAASTILAYRILSNGQLQYLSGAAYGAGSGANCMVEDPTSQYIYVSNHNDGTISGFVFDNTHGTLAPLSRGSTFNATGQLQCLVLSGNVD